MNLLSQHGEHYLMADIVKAASDIALNEPRRPGPGLADIPQRGMAPAALPEPVRAARETRFIVRLQKKPHYFADQLI